MLLCWKFLMLSSWFLSGGNDIFTELAHGKVEQWGSGTALSWSIQTEVHVCWCSGSLECQNIVLSENIHFCTVYAQGCLLVLRYIYCKFTMFLLFINFKISHLVSQLHTHVLQVWLWKLPPWLVMSYCKRDGECYKVRKGEGRKEPMEFSTVL